MPRKWIRNRAWERQPHVKTGAPPSLWWYRRPDKYRVVDAYLEQCKRGRALPEGFRDDLVHWLQALSDLQSLKAWGKPRTWRYWSIPAYALAHKMNPKTFCKRFREMEEIARRLFSDSVPASRKQRGPLTEAEKISIRKRYLQGEDCAALAQEFGLKSSHVGLLCRKEKAARRTEQEAKAAKENESAPMQEIVEPAQPF